MCSSDLNCFSIVSKVAIFGDFLYLYHHQKPVLQIQLFGVGVKMSSMGICCFVKVMPAQ